MRLSVTCPDGLGDFLLRLPWLQAMVASGWALQIIARAPTLELARLAGLSAHYVPIRRNPYGKEARRVRYPFRRELAAVAAFRPDYVFLGPSQPSFFEEQTAEHLPNLRVGGFRLASGFWPGEGLQDPRELAARYAFAIEVEQDDNERQRNAKAARFFLGDDFARESPAFRFSPDFIASLPKPDGIGIVVNAAYREGDYFRGWGDENWCRELDPIAAHSPLFFVGTAAEAASHQRIMAGLTRRAGHRDLTGKLPDLRSLCSVLAAGEAYIGKDCGVMHLAAALGKPVLAVFGGGHWPRFLPAGSEAVILTALVPCRGCDWRCHLPEPVCVRGLPSGCLAEAWHQLQTMNQGETVVVELPPAADQAHLLRPAEDYPARRHLERRARLSGERDTFLRSPWRRWTAAVGFSRCG
jgi:hypothetical protein